VGSLKSTKNLQYLRNGARLLYSIMQSIVGFSFGKNMDMG